MFAYACPYCAGRFAIAPGFAGGSVTCPACKKVLVLKTPAEPVPVPQGAIEGHSSSLVRAGITAPGPATSSDEKPAGDRFVLVEEIARGGMGAVIRARDCDIGREVAVKYLLDQDDQGKQSRFVEEAQITGQLEHPNIVPVHELGVDAQKRLFFSMKIVHGGAGTGDRGDEG